MGIGHFLALRWIIWPTEVDDSPPSPDGVPATGDMPPAIFDTIMRFISHGLSLG